MNITDPKTDDRIREALNDAERKGRLGIVAALTSIGESELRKIMDSTEPLDIADRGMLGMHLQHGD